MTAIQFKALPDPTKFQKFNIFLSRMDHKTTSYTTTNPHHHSIHTNENILTENDLDMPIPNLRSKIKNPTYHAQRCSEC